MPSYLDQTRDKDLKDSLLGAPPCKLTKIKQTKFGTSKTEDRIRKITKVCSNKTRI